MKKIIFLILISLYSLQAEEVIEKLNNYYETTLKKNNYENFNIVSNGYYSKVDSSNIYLNLLKDKVSKLDDKYYNKDIKK